MEEQLNTGRLHWQFLGVGETRPVSSQCNSAREGPLSTEGRILLCAHDLPSTKCLPTAVPLALERLLLGVRPLVSLDMLDSPGDLELARGDGSNAMGSFY
jgi:hypothetical protein